MKIITLIASVIILGGCTGSRVMYDNNGLKLVQVGADPTPINGGYNVVVAEQNGVSTLVAVDSTGTIVEQIALPAAAIGGAAVLRPDETNVIDSSTNINRRGIRFAPRPR